MPRYGQREGSRIFLKDFIPVRPFKPHKTHNLYLVYCSTRRVHVDLSKYL